jgi:DMSO reductase anchor subunit
MGPLLGFETLSMSAHPVALPLLLFGLIGVQTLALVMSTLHLGKPHLFYRAFNNLRYSPVSREVAGIAVFYNFLGAYTLLSGLPMLFAWLPASLTAGLIQLCGWGAVISGLAALYFMHSIYRIPARPFWNHWQVLTAFYGSMLTLGPLLVLLTYIAAQVVQGQPWASAVNGFAWLILAGLVLEAVGLAYHARDLRREGGEGMASHYEQCTKFGKTWLTRNAGMGVSMLLLVLVAVLHLEGDAGLFLWLTTAMVIVATALIGRALFYALVIPTTMPGAFFWRNKGFEEHARETGLAEMPQVGVLPECH